MARLTSKQRKALPRGDFALPDTRQYPDQDAAHARDALSRVAANGTPAQRAQVKAAVARKYPSIGAGGKGRTAIRRRSK